MTEQVIFLRAKLTIGEEGGSKGAMTGLERSRDQVPSGHRFTAG